MTAKCQARSIAIAGAGITGAYLHRRLSQMGVSADIYDIDPKTVCGLHPCAWGTSRGFDDFVRTSGLETDRYVLQRPDYILIDGVRLPAELITFDKPSLLRDLLAGASIRYSPLDLLRYDRIIDATGVKRSFLPAVKNDVVLPCIQWRVQGDRLLPNQIDLGRIGYAWCFPLSANCYHIGCGSLGADPRERIRQLGWLQSSGRQTPWQIICKCRAQIRLTSPQHSQPFFVEHGKEGIWGVGEAIGCVAPLAGDGIISGMRSVEILLQNWDDPEAYAAAILSEFKWMKREREVIDKLRQAKLPDIGDALVLKRNSRRMGIQIGLRDAFKLVSRLK